MQCSSEFRREENREVVRDVGNAVAVVVDGAEPDGRHLAVEDVVDVERFGLAEAVIGRPGIGQGSLFAGRFQPFEIGIPQSHWL